MDLLLGAVEHVRQHPDLFRQALTTHVVLSGLALLLAAAIAIPAAIVVNRQPRAALVAVNSANVLRTLPSLAVLALMLPIVGIGFRPALIALVVIGLPPILTNTYVGLRQVDADAIDSARGMGMTAWQILGRIELPLAVPVMLAGLRIAAVQIVASATLAAFIGGGGLGDFITTGIGMMQMDVLLVGAVPVTLLAVGTDIGLGRLENLLTPRGIREPA